MEGSYLKEEKKHLIAFVENFPSILWREGYYEAMSNFIERIGRKYAWERVEEFRRLGLFSEEEIKLFLELEEFIIEYLEKNYPFWICFQANELRKFNNLRKKIIEHFSETSM